MIEVIPTEFPQLMEKYTKEVSRYYPTPLQLVIISYISAQPEPIHEFYIIQKMERIFPKHPERMIKHELNQLYLKKILQINSEQKYWIDFDSIRTHINQIFSEITTDIETNKLSSELLDNFNFIKNRVLTLLDKTIGLIPTFYEMKIKDLKKFFHNLIRKFGLQSIQQVCENQINGEKVDFNEIINQLQQDLQTFETEKLPEITPPIARNVYNANRKVKVYNETAKGTRMYFYSEKTDELVQDEITFTQKNRNQNHNSVNNSQPQTPKYVIKKTSVVFGVPKRRGLPPINVEGNDLPRKHKKPKRVSSDKLIIESGDQTNIQMNNQNSVSIIIENPQQNNHRPRGRPPKNPDEKKQDPTPLRPRGRPPKNKNEHNDLKSNELNSDKSFLNE